jgi:hypothetical protein
MATTRPLTVLARAKPPSAALLAYSRHRIAPRTAVCFSTSSPRAATPSGPPPSGFRMPVPRRWDQSKESSLDKAGKYFLMTEIFRGMWVVLEQFFRPPYVDIRMPPLLQQFMQPANRHVADTQSTTLLKKVQSLRASVANTPCGDTPLVKNDALRASSVKQSAPPKPSQLRPRSAKMAAEGPPDTIST